MLSTKHAKTVCKILAWLLAAAVSFGILTQQLPDSAFIKESLDSVEHSKNTVLAFSAATLSASLAISAFPDDFATPLAQNLANMNTYFILILIVLFFEKILIIYGVKITFYIIVPLACVVGALSSGLKNISLKMLAVRLLALGFAVALVVPCSTHLTELIAADLNAYVEETIAETEASANKINEATEEGDDEKSIFEKLSDLFMTAINGISDLVLYIQNTIRKCMNAIAILFLVNFLMPVLNFFAIKWILKETFRIAIPMPQLKRRREVDPESMADEKELVGVGD